MRGKREGGLEKICILNRLLGVSNTLKMLIQEIEEQLRIFSRGNFLSKHHVDMGCLSV